MSESLSSQ